MASSSPSSSLPLTSVVEQKVLYLEARLSQAETQVGELRKRLFKKENKTLLPKQVARTGLKLLSAKVAPYAYGIKVANEVYRRIPSEKSKGGKRFDPSDPADKSFDASETEHLMRHCQAAYLASGGPGTQDPEKIADGGPTWMVGADGKVSLEAALANGLGDATQELKLLEYHDHKATDTQAYVAKSTTRPGELYVVCRGTTTITDWLTDFQISKTLFEPENDSFEDDFKSCGGCCGQISFSCDYANKPLVHIGFYRSFLTMRDMIDRHVKHTLADGQKIKKVYVCGHSLGGALACVVLPYVLKVLNPATLAKNGTEVTLFTVGAPRVGTDGYVKMIDKLSAPLKAKNLYRTFRCVNDVDVVPRIPPHFLAFRHIGVLHLFLESERESEPDPGKATLVIGGEMSLAHDRSVLGYVGHASELVSDHMVPAYRAMNADQFAQSSASVDTTRAEPASA